MCAFPGSYDEAPTDYYKFECFLVMLCLNSYPGASRDSLILARKAESPIQSLFLMSRNVCIYCEMPNTKGNFTARFQEFCDRLETNLVFSIQFKLN